MIRRPLIIGQAPGQQPGRVLDGRCGMLLAELAGLSGYAALSRRFRLENLLPTWPGHAGQKGDAFPRENGRAAADARRARLVDTDTVVLLGRNVAWAFGLDDLLYCVWDDMPGKARAKGGYLAVPVIVIPHPSAVNRCYNRAANCRKVGDVLRGLAGWAP